ncbi:MAG: hypothetical protein ACFFCM_08870 [Promethearchaeota archaeon]
MKKGFFSIIIFIQITLALLIITIQPIKAIGPNLEEETDGFIVREGQILRYKITFADSNYSSKNVGDLLEFTITELNNTNGSGWIADRIYGIFRDYNITSGIWTTLPEMCIASYNSTTPYYAFQSTCYYYTNIGVPPLIICRNFSAANHTIVNLTYSQKFSANPSFQYIGPSTINGTWQMWDGSAITPGSKMYEESYNKLGILIKYAEYINGTSDWHKINEMVIINEKESLLNPIQMLLLISTNSTGGGLGAVIITGLISAIVIGILIAVIFLKKLRLEVRNSK